MSRASATERSRRVTSAGQMSRSDVQDEIALRSLKQGASLVKAAHTSGLSISTLYRHGVVRRYADWLDKRKPQDPPSPERR